MTTSPVFEEEDLPEGWSSAAIAEVFEVNPVKPKAGALAPEAHVSFVPMEAVDAGAGAIIAPEERRFGEVRKGYTGFADGDVLMAKITPSFENGKAAIARNLRNGLGFGSSEFHVFRPKGAVLPEILLHFIRHEAFRERAAQSMTGTAGQARVPVRFIKSTSLPIPPLAEQRRIAEKVCAVFAEVDAARDRLASVPLLLKRLLRSVLAAACSGRLTEEWREARSA